MTSNAQTQEPIEPVLSNFGESIISARLRLRNSFIDFHPSDREADSQHTDGTQMRRVRSISLPLSSELRSLGLQRDARESDNFYCSDLVVRTRQLQQSRASQTESEVGPETEPPETTGLEDYLEEVTEAEEAVDWEPMDSLAPSSSDLNMARSAREDYSGLAAASSNASVPQRGRAGGFGGKGLTAGVASQIGDLRSQMGDMRLERGPQSSSQSSSSQAAPVSPELDYLEQQQSAEFPSASSDSNDSSRVRGSPVTTLMICNIPCKLQLPALEALINTHGFVGTYDFLYLPGRGQSCSNMGYAFINFHTAESAVQFTEVFNGVPYSQLSEIKTEKIISIRPARLQGYDNNVKALNHSHKKPLWLEYRLLLNRGDQQHT